MAAKPGAGKPTTGNSTPNNAVDMTIGRIITRGPFFDGRTAKGIRGMIDEIGDEIIVEVEKEWQRNMRGSFKVVQPFYWTQVEVDKIQPGKYRAHDNGVVYGKWLEGTSRRNQETRFKGYQSLERAVATVKAKIPRIINTIVGRRLKG